MDELVADGAGAADEEVEFFVVAHEEGIVQDVEGFAQQGALDDERDAHFEGAEGDGVHTDAVATEDGEQSADGTGVMAEILAHHGHGGQACATTGGIHGAGGNFLCELGIENVAGALRIGRSDGERSRGFRSRLRHHEHADAGLCQSGEDAAIDTDHTDHGHTADGDQSGLADGGNAANEARAGCSIAANDGVPAAGVEGVAHQNGNVAHTHGEDGGGIDYFRAEVAQFGGFVVRKFVDREGGGDDAGIGGHETVDIGPDFEHFGTEGGGKNGGRVVRTAATEVGGAAAFDIGRDETAHHSEGTTREIGLGNGRMRGVEIDDVFRAFGARANEATRIDVAGAEQRGHDGRRNAFAVGYNGIGCFGREFADEVNAL